MAITSSSSSCACCTTQIEETTGAGVFPDPLECFSNKNVGPATQYCKASKQSSIAHFTNHSVSIFVEEASSSTSCSPESGHGKENNDNCCKKNNSCSKKVCSQTIAVEIATPTEETSPEDERPVSTDKNIIAETNSEITNKNARRRSSPLKEVELSPQIIKAIKAGKDLEHELISKMSESQFAGNNSKISTTVPDEVEKCDETSEEEKNVANL